MSTVIVLAASHCTEDRDRWSDSHSIVCLGKTLLNKFCFLPLLSSWERLTYLIS